MRVGWRPAAGDRRLPAETSGWLPAETNGRDWPAAASGDRGRVGEWVGESEANGKVVISRGRDDALAKK